MKDLYMNAIIQHDYGSKKSMLTSLKDVKVWVVAHDESSRKGLEKSDKPEFGRSINQYKAQE